MEKVKILLARHVFEGHDLGIRMVAFECRNQGMEVIFIRFTDVEEIVKSAQEEDVSVVGLTTSSGAHFFLVGELITALKKSQVELPVIIGGVIPKGDEQKLLEMGVKKVFGSGSTPRQTAEYILNELFQKQSA